MKRSTLYLLVISVAFSLNLNAKKKKNYYETMNKKVDTSYDDSLRLKAVSVGDVFIVAADHYVVFHAIVKEKENYTDFAKPDTLKAGSKFKVVDMVRLSNILTPYVQLQDSSKAYLINIFRLNRYCYKEGQSSIPPKIIRQLDKGLELRRSPFWIILAITLGSSILFLVLFSYINRLFSKWAKKKSVKKNIAGIAFLTASALMGAVIGITVLFYTDEFKEFVMYFPHLNFPGTGTLVQKLYWFSQPLFLAFLSWLIFRNIKELGVLKGLLLTLILVISGIVMFWSSLVLSFLVVLGLLIVLIMSAVGTVASTAGEMPSQVTIKEEMGSTGEMQSVKYTKSSSGRISKSNN